jgi:flagellar assembly factor FliW
VSPDVPESHHLVLPAGLPGFPGAFRWELAELEEDSPFAVMTSLEVPDLELLVALPFSFFPDWEVELADADADRLGIVDPADAMILVIVNSGDRPEEATVNLLAPLVVNVGTGLAAQIVLRGELAQVRRPLFDLVPA